LNNFAISSGGIGEAMKRSASSMKAANNTIDETIALITAANTVVQSPEKVGTAFKTISMRIRGAKTELEEAGEETDGMVESTAQLRQEILALSGVDIMENDNTFKSTYAILDELALKWKDLSDIQQANCLPVYAEMYSKNIFNCR
jgi:TP901 family phage tail tape measure protein